jgi:putative ABC transport system permease protein
MRHNPGRKSFFRLLRRRQDIQSEVDEELRLHIELTAEKLAAAGMSPAAARLEAARRFGDLEALRQECTEIDWRQLRSERRVEVMSEFFQDCRYAGRVLLKQPAFAAVVLLTLALGIGANIALFSVVQGIVLRPLPYREPDRLAMIWTQFLEFDLPKNWVSQPELLELREDVKSFEEIAAVAGGAANLTGPGGEPERLSVGQATPNLFSVLGVAPALGRVFTRQEGEPGASDVVLLAHGLWQRRYGGDPSIVGQSIRLDGEKHTVVGVLPAAFDLEIAPSAELWAPLVLDRANLGARGSHYLQTIARLRPGATLAQAQAELQALAARQIEAGSYDVTSGWGINAVPLHEEVVGDVRTPLLVLLGAVGFVLLIACANVANLLLARTAARSREMAIRRAVGAGSRRLLRQMLTESVLLSTLGGALGLAVAWGALRLLQGLGPDLPRLGSVTLDLGALGFALGLSVLTGLLFGLAPAWQARHGDLVESLKDRGPDAGQAPSRHRLQSTLVVVEVGLALVLLAGAGLMLRSFWQMSQVSPGFRPDGVLSFRISLPQAQYPEDEGVNALYDALLERLRGIPGVQAAGAVSIVPMAGFSSSGTVTIERPSRGAEPLAYVETDYRWTRPGYFESMGLRLIEGRFLGEADRAGAARVAVIDETMARRFWPGESGLGKRIARGGGHGRPDEERWHTVVGVVEHVKNYALNVQGREQAYVPAVQLPFAVRATYVTVKTQGDPAGLLGAVRAEVRALDPALPLADVRTMDERMSRSIAQPRFHLLLLGLFAALAVVLASVGIYGVLSYMVSQRTRELGIRMALGARRADVLRLVLWQGMRRVLLGMALGLGAALALTPVLSSQLFEVEATDPLTFAGISALLAAVALVATLLPAFKATRVAPQVALRQD